MRPGGGKAKGSQFERDIARRLSLWWSGGETENVFWRSPSSGMMKKEGMAGDISALHGGDSFIDFIFCELKYYKDVDYTSWLTKKTACKVFEWFAKAEEECDQVGSTHVWLIVKANRHNPVIVVSHQFIKDAVAVAGRWLESLPSIRLQTGMGDSLSVFDLESVLDLLDPVAVKEWGTKGG